MHIVNSHIQTRANFGSLLNQLGLAGNAVEIGTHRGVFASQWLDSWPVGKLTCVDPWAKLDDYDDAINTLDREADYEDAKRATEHHTSRVNFVRLKSLDAAALFEDRSLDCVYIDGNHWRPFVDDDIAAWWPKVRSGGILAGHDWSDFWAKQVQGAVLDFAKHAGLDVFVIDEFEATWYVVRP